MFRTNSRRRAWKIRRQTVRQVFCLLTAVSLVFQQVGVGYAYCTGLGIYGPCAGNPSPCCASQYGRIVGGDGASGGGGGCWGGSCRGEENAFEPATSANPVHLMRGTATAALDALEQPLGIQAPISEHDHRPGRRHLAAQRLQ